MTYILGHTTREDDIVALFTETFTASEGADEGALIGVFVRDMIQTTPEEDLIVVSSYEDHDLAGCIFLSRLRFPDDSRSVFILSPVAVKTACQKTGIGQQLITHGLNVLRQRRVDYVLTYGDPNYYVKTGFQQVTEDFVQAPLALSHPEGWLGQALSDLGKARFATRPTCVPALNNPALW